MKKVDIELVNASVKNIQAMAPYLSEREQYIVLGMLLADTGRVKPESKKMLEPKKTG